MNLRAERRPAARAGLVEELVQTVETLHVGRSQFLGEHAEPAEEAQGPTPGGDGVARARSVHGAGQVHDCDRVISGEERHVAGAKERFRELDFVLSDRFGHDERNGRVPGRVAPRSDGSRAAAAVSHTESRRAGSRRSRPHAVVRDDDDVGTVRFQAIGEQPR